MITKQKFDEAMVKGFKKFGFAKHYFYTDKLGITATDTHLPTTRACAIGAANWALTKNTDYRLCLSLVPSEIFDKITKANNAAKSRKGAIEAVKAIEW